MRIYHDKVSIYSLTIHIPIIYVRRRLLSPTLRKSRSLTIYSGHEPLSVSQSILTILSSHTQVRWSPWSKVESLFHSGFSSETFSGILWFGSIVDQPADEVQSEEDVQVKMKQDEDDLGVINKNCNQKLTNK